MKALTIRRLSPDLARAIEKKARKDGTSLSGAVVAILEEATGVVKKRKVIHHDLDRFFGTWSAEEAREFDKNLAEQRKIDPELWK